MRHPTEGVLRRLLDEPAGVADSDREHLAGCPQCLGGLASVSESAGVVDSAPAPGASRRRPVPVEPAGPCAVPRSPPSPLPSY